MECKFCLDDCEQLIESHIVPKFIHRWIKKTSSTGRLRNAQNINRPAQDGLKVEFLCDKCEGDFSTVEKYFSEHVFMPITNNDGDFSSLNLDQEKFRKFLVSVIWRVAKYSVNNENINGNWTSEEILRFNSCIDELKEAYLNNGISRFNTYLVPTNSHFAKKKLIAIEDYAYFERAVSMNFMIYDDHNGRASVLVKIPFMLIVCEFISSPNDRWAGLNINQEVTFYAEECEVPSYVSDYMNYECETIYAETGTMSDVQQKKIKEIFSNKADASQGTVKAILKDANKENDLH